MAITNGPKLDLMVDGIEGENHYPELMRLLRGLDVLIQCRVVNHTTVTPPLGGLSDGVAYIVGNGGLGAWFDKDNQIARYSTVLSAWEFFPTGTGFVAYSQDLGEHIMLSDSDGWVLLRTGLPPPSTAGNLIAALGSAEIPSGFPRVLLADGSGTFVRAGLGHASAKAASAGKRFFEFRSPDSAAGNANITFGCTTLEGSIADFDEATVTVPDSFGYSGGFVRGNSEVYGNFGALLASGSGSVGVITSNQTVGFAVNLTTKKFWYQINGGSWYGGGDPAAGTGGYSIGDGVFDFMVPFALVMAPNYEVTFNGKSSDFSVTPPSGFLGWDD